MNDSPQRVALVVTTIAAPNAHLERLSRGCREHGYEFIAIGDEASPRDFQLDGCRFYSLDEQLELKFNVASLCPRRHYARKSLGYLIAMRNGADLILETDDDNTPYANFWRARRRRQTARLATAAGWLNVYRYFSPNRIWPRGFALDRVHDDPPEFESLPMREADCPIQQALTNEDPDVDAIYRLTARLPQSFTEHAPIALGQGSWCSFNSQNTAWFRAAFPLLYLPAYCSFRMTDIWRSFVAQRIAWTNEWSVLYEGPSGEQQRNAHDLLKDFQDEVPGYLNNSTICEALAELVVEPCEAAILNNLRTCYEKLCEMKFVDARELDLLEAWIADVTELNPSTG